MSLRGMVTATAAVSAVAVVAGCSTPDAPSADTRPSHRSAPATADTAPATGSSEPTADPEEVGANELGLVPVLMYHRLVDEPDSVYDRTPEAFRAELRRLAEEGYVPVTTAEFASGELDLPAGAHPVVLTFDDGDPSTVRVTPDGEPVEGTAVRILTEVAEEYPDFRATASVYVNADPFGGGAAGERALRWLHQNGFEVGNHTHAHTNLSTAGRESAEDAIVEGHESIRAVLPDHEPTTLALPFGARPDPAELALRGDGYDYDAVLLVGANPAPSPFAENFDPAGVPRIRSQGPDGSGAEFGSTAWLDKLADNPDLRYTSDGDPSRISYPAGTDTPAAEFAEAAQPY
ncbi:polysaccharide deacetylase family protein [Saccharomonospora iraqiensis]|uniref:polysaccharide deacetylase family protein n=1 Tax=Saccharomonospora iraqiensis TaxID=52698 RepID=UPI00048E9CDA|nr:polysaccharide deacetylase family protein [Saccharomonospora iraqiensis]